MSLDSKSTSSTQELCVENLPRSAMLEEKNISSLLLNNSLVGYKIRLKLFYFDTEKVSLRSIVATDKFDTSLLLIPL